VLAIGGVGGLAVGLAGREILENLFTGLIILSSNPFEVRHCLFVLPACFVATCGHRRYGAVLCPSVCLLADTVLRCCQASPLPTLPVCATPTTTPTLHAIAATFACLPALLPAAGGR
jgi:hypothetical protein